MPETPPPRRRRARRPAALLALVATVLLVAGCNADNSAFGRQGLPDPVTKQAKITLHLWQGSWLAAWIIGAIVWGLILWSAFAFRKRGDELPRQVRYNIPIEILYTVVPFVIIAVLFYFTARDQTDINKLPKNPDVTVHVVGFQWSWQFTYEDVYGKPGGLTITGRPGEPPQLVIPTGQTIEFVETSPDVIHSFWVIPFLFKRDVIPGRTNRFAVTVTKPGTFQGKCTEYCGLDHARMLFTVKAVSPAEFQSFLTKTAAIAASGNNTTYTVPQTASGSTS